MRPWSTLPYLLVGIVTAQAALAAPAPTPAQPPTYPGLSRRVPGGARVLQIAGNDDPSRFKLDWHEQLSALKASQCTEVVDRAHWSQDLFHQGDSAAHFDNCAFAEGAAFVAAQVEILRTRGALADKDEKARAEALAAMGRALHAIQDFYSHSNYLERLDRSQPAGKPVALVVLPFWTEAGLAELTKQAQAGLASGTWLLGEPKRCQPRQGNRPALSHGELAKDNLGTKAGKSPLTHGKEWKLAKGFNGAFALARMATEQFIKDVVPPQLVNACGGGLGVLLAEDERKEK